MTANEVTNIKSYSDSVGLFSHNKISIYLG